MAPPQLDPPLADTTSEWDPGNLVFWGGGVLVFAGLCGIVAYPLGLLYSWASHREANPLNIAAHAAYICGVAALAFALVWLIFISP